MSEPVNDKLRPGAERYLGIEIGGSKLQVVIGDAEARVLQRWREPVDREQGGAGICRQIERIVAQAAPGAGLRAAGVGFGGPVDWRQGRVHVSHHVHGWEQFDLVGWLGEISGVPVVMDNDANVAALGETLSGAGRGASPVFYVTLGSGVGGGMTIEGRIFHGQPPGECEFGHLRLDRAETTVESRCSGWAIDRRIRQLQKTEPHCLLCKLMDATAGGEARHLAAALEGGDPVAGRILNELADDLAFGLSHAVHLLHPQVIILGGGLALVGEPLRSAVAKALPARIMSAFAPGPAVALSALKEDAVPVGALHLARLSAP